MIEYRIHSKFDEIKQYFDKLMELDYTQRRIPKNFFKSEIKIVKKIEIPTFLTHCTRIHKFQQLIEDQKFGGREVISGNIEAIFDKTHFSPVPYLVYSNYDIALIFKTEILLKENPEKKLYPTFYQENQHNHLIDEEFAFFFNDEGWNKIQIKDIPDRDHVKFGSYFIDEKEWNMKNPIHFDYEDIYGVIIKDMDHYCPEYKELIHDWFIAEVNRFNIQFEKFEPII